MSRVYIIHTIEFSDTQSGTSGKMQGKIKEKPIIYLLGLAIYHSGVERSWESQEVTALVHGKVIRLLTCGKLKSRINRGAF